MSHVVMLSGGVGNQLFQYGFGLWLAEESGLAVEFDSSAFRGSNRAMQLGELGLPTPGVDRWRNRMLPNPQGRMPALARAMRTASGPRRICLERERSLPENTSEPAWWCGYWQRMSFASFALERLRSGALSTVAQVDALGVHVRRTDYLGNALALAAADYRKMVLHAEQLGANLDRVFVVSDDPDWCRSHLDLGVPFECWSGGSAVEDMKLLAGCRSLVLSRSTFSWWAAMLSEVSDLVVVADPFFPNEADKQLDLIPAPWKRVNVQ